MSADMTVEDVAAVQDAAVLWGALKDAKEAGDLRLVRAIENRMRELGEQRRFSHLTDEQLASQIRALSGNRAPEDMLAYSPAEGQGLEGAPGTASLNREIRANQHVGIETTLGALLDEWQRRHPDAEGTGH